MSIKELYKKYRTDYFKKHGKKSKINKRKFKKQQKPLER